MVKRYFLEIKDKYVVIRLQLVLYRLFPIIYVLFHNVAYFVKLQCDVIYLFVSLFYLCR